MQSSQGKIIITGTGRAGTTFLVQLLTELGMDTGYTPRTWQRDYKAHCAAGLERDLAEPNTPRIVKSPALCETLPGILARGGIVIDHAIIPIRALEEATQSRIAIGGSGEIPGGLVGTDEAANQKLILAENFHRLVHTVTAHEIPHTFLYFPRFARDARYTWQKLGWLLDGMDFETFSAAFTRIARPELIHDFSAGTPANAGEPGRQFAREQSRKRLQRRLKRVLLWGALGAAAWIIIAWQRT